MWQESGEQQKKLRSGLSTGSCATACSLAGAKLLLTDKVSESSDIRLPKGRMVNLKLQECKRLSARKAYTSTIKDAGDDPDATHGATVFTVIRLEEATGITFTAAEGVGTVTLEGLLLAVGEPAINPMPREMIRCHLQDLALESGYGGGFNVAIGVVNGEKIAKKTMNARLGILGGLSILGTTGIVRPFSCAAYIASIHQGFDVAAANGIEHMAACTGNTSEKFAAEKFALSDMALMEMGDFVGAVFKYLKSLAHKQLSNKQGPQKRSQKHPQNRRVLKRLSIVGGFGKISKLACGHKDLHSKKSSIDFDFLAQVATDLGADEKLALAIKQANTSIEALGLCKSIALADEICKYAWRHARKAVPTEIAIDLWAIDRKGNLVGHCEQSIGLTGAS